MIGRILFIAGAVAADARRRKIIWVVVFFAAIMAAAIPSLPSYGAGVVEAVFREVALTLTYAATMVVTLALAANRIPSEIERRTIYGLLTRSVRRWEYVVGTWLGIVLTVAAVVAAFCAIIVAVGWIAYGEPMLVLAQGGLAIWMEAAVVAAFCVTISSVSGPVIVSVAALTFLFITHVRSSLLAPDTIAWRLYPSLDAFNVIAPVAHGSGVGVSYVASMAAVLIGWAGALLVISVMLFGRRDL